jgi:hypothetical protein
MNVRPHHVQHADDGPLPAIALVGSNSPDQASADTAGAPVDVTLLDTPAACATQLDAWAGHRAACGVLTPNNDPALYRAVLDADDATQPMVMVARQNNDVTGMIIGRTAHRRLTSRMGYATLPTIRLHMLDVVHGGVLLRNDAATHALSTHLLRLLENRDVEGIMFNHLPVETSFRDILFGGLKGLPTMQRGPDSPHWRFHLAPGGFDETLQRFSRKHRYNIRRARRLLENAFEGEVTVACHRHASEFDAFIACVNAITQQSYQGALSQPIDPGTAEHNVLKCAAAQGQLRGYVLACAGRPVAHQVGIVCGETYHLRATAFDPAFAEHSPGQVLLVRVMEDLAGTTIRHIDYGYGDGAYKRVYGTDCGTDRTQFVFGRHLRARVGHLQMRCLQQFDRTARAACRRGRTLKSIKCVWRTRLSRAHRRGHHGH